MDCFVEGPHLFLFCSFNVLFTYYQVWDFISHITEPLVEMDSLTKAHMHARIRARTRTHTPALGFVWLFYLPVNPLFLESPQAVQT